MNKTMSASKKSTTAPLPVTIVAGFLGAGKTTMITHLLQTDHGRRIAIVVNDFGSINIDAELISDVSEGIVNLTNGCICCVIRRDLISELLRLAALPERPDHIVIESSGVADPAGIVRGLMVPEIRRTVLLDGVITVVDAEQALALPDEEAELARAQVASSDMVVVNKVDLVNIAQLVEVQAWIKVIRPGAQVFVATHCRLPIKVLLGIAGSRDQAHVHDASPGMRAETRYM